MIILYSVAFSVLVFQIAFRIRTKTLIFNVSNIIYFVLLAWSFARLLYYCLPVFSYNRIDQYDERAFTVWLEFFGGDLILTCLSILFVSWYNCELNFVNDDDRMSLIHKDLGHLSQYRRKPEFYRGVKGVLIASNTMIYLTEIAATITFRTQFYRSQFGSLYWGLYGLEVLIFGILCIVYGIKILRVLSSKEARAKFKMVFFISILSKNSS